MNQLQRLTYLVDFLIDEYMHSDISQESYDYFAPVDKTVTIGEKPFSVEEKKRLLRELLNVRPPKAINQDFIKVQNEYLQEELAKKLLKRLEDLPSLSPGLYLWQGDITTLQVDAIVNAANSMMLGCFIPGHMCIDNVIHTNAGVELRLACNEIIQKQGHKEPVGKAKITQGFNLPANYVIHTVGPIVNQRVTALKRDLLASSYRSCLKLADEYNLKHIAFCCISTGEFAFPQIEAAEIAIQTVKDYLSTTQSSLQVIFNVFTDTDLAIYQEKLGRSVSS